MGVLPEVQVSILQNSLGLQDPSQGDALAIVGPATAGTLETPGLYGRATAAQADFEDGPLVEAAACALEITGRPVVLVRCDTTTVGAMGAIDDDGITGTCEVTATAGQEPIDDYEPYVEIVDGGMVKTTGTTYRTSFDGGGTMSPLTALGTALVIDMGKGVKFDLNPNEAEFVAFVVNLRTKALAHFIYTTGSVHLAADTTSDDNISAAPTTWATGIDVLNDIRAGLILHAANLTAHTAADSVSFAALPAAAVTRHEAVDLAIAIDAAFPVHLATTASVHGAADAANVLTVDAPTHGTLVAGDFWSTRTTAPKWDDTQLDAALLALQRSGYAWKTLLILGPISTVNTCNVITARLDAMQAAYKYKKVFGEFRVPNAAETEAAYLAAFKAAFDTVTDYRLRLCAGAVEFQSCAKRPRIYKRSPAFIAGALHVALGPAVSLAFVNDGAGALPLGATIQDANLNPKHHDEALDPGLDAARALVLRTHHGYPGRCFFTRDRTLAALGTDYMLGLYWATTIEVLDVVVPRLVGRLQGVLPIDPETGRILEEEAKDIEAIFDHEIETKVTDKRWITKAFVRIDRTVNLLTSPTVPIDLSIVPLVVADKFALTVALKNPAYQNA